MTAATAGPFFPALDDARPRWFIPVQEDGRRQWLVFRFPLSLAFRKSRPLAECPVEVIDMASRERPRQALPACPYGID